MLHSSRDRHYEHNVSAGLDVEGAIPSAINVEKPKAEPAVQLKEQTRIIDANLLADRFVPGAVATLTVAIRLPENLSRGKWQRQAKINPGKGPIHVLVNAQGFEAISEPPPPIVLPADRDSAPIAFELRILEASERWLHVLVTQAGFTVGQLVINDFSAIGAGPVHNAARTAVCTLLEADLTLLVRTGERRIEAYSPRDRACLSGITISDFQQPTQPFSDILRNRLKKLYDERADAEETARDLQIFGVEMAKLLPSDLIKLLRLTGIHSLMLLHEEDFEFPIELCYLDDEKDPFFVGDRMAVCRWYMGVTNPPDVTAKRIRKVAFLRGRDAYEADENLLNRLYPGRMETFTRKADVIEQLFKTVDFDLIHFTGHCRVNDQGMGGLGLADESFLRLIDIGQLESERAFTKAQPFVMVNACASGQPFVALTNRDSFPHRFVTSQACAFIGTLWPVSGPVANEFARHFYAELLAGKPIGLALLAAKEALRDQDAERGEAAVSPQRKLARQVALRSYCLFANPDLRLVA